MKYIYYKNLAAGRWFELSFLQQMGNIGSDVYRAIKWFKLKDVRFQKSFEMALELFDLTLRDNRWETKRKQIEKCNNLFCSVMLEPEKYENLDKKLELLNRYFDCYALKANEERYREYKVKNSRFHMP